MIYSLMIAALVLLYIFAPLQKHVRGILAAVVIGGLYLLFWPSIYKNYRLEKEGEHTIGTLLSKKCEIKNNQTISYKFHVGSKEYMGSQKPGAGNQSCENFQVGDQVFITYLVSDPNINAPEREVDSDIFLGIFFSFTMAGFLMWINAEQARFRQKKLKNRAKSS